MPFSEPLAKSRPIPEIPTLVRPPFSGGPGRTVMPGLCGAQLTVTVQPRPGEGVGEMFQRLAATLKEFEAVIVHLLVFGKTSASPVATAAMRQVFGGIEWPVTWVEGAACEGSPIAGVQAFAFAGGDVHRLRADGQVVGSVFEDGAFRHCVIGGLGPEQKTAPRAEQTQATLDQLSAALAEGGFALADVLRTWFYLDDMLAWYDEFNRVRTQVYSGINFRTGSLPASTGIGGRNPAGAALVAGAWAARPLNGDARIQEVASPLQCPAPAYGSSFSRAMEMSSPAGRRLFISGTASISPTGRTLWVEDVRKQVSQTMWVVEAILQSRGYALPDVTRATAYFKHRTYARAFMDWCAARNLLSWPVVSAHCDVCRDDLLFELEADAWRPSRAG
jgi:enamine deaminase RidA (YjgF/YER057c/UK114 family)